MDAKGKLIKELGMNFWAWNSDGESIAEDIADFIISDRKRIVAPLVRHKELWCGNWSEYTARECIDKAIRLSEE